MIEQATYNSGYYAKATALNLQVTTKLFPPAVGQLKPRYAGQFFRASLFVIVTQVTVADTVTFYYNSRGSIGSVTYNWIDGTKVFNMPCNAVGDMGTFEILAPYSDLPAHNSQLQCIHSGGGNVLVDVYFKIDYLEA